MGCIGDGSRCNKNIRMEDEQVVFVGNSDVRRFPEFDSEMTYNIDCIAYNFGSSLVLMYYRGGSIVPGTTSVWVQTSFRMTHFFVLSGMETICNIYHDC